MEESSGEESGLSQLLSEENTVLLDLIDKLRSLGINKDVPLPEIIVCGDQSSGKSSVLEAISHLSFPKGQGFCTAFPTELALRRSATHNTSVSIQPAPGRTEEAKVILSTFPSHEETIEDFKNVVESAKKELAKCDPTKNGSVFKDTLRVEVSRPDWPPFTLIDLPGLIKSPNRGQVKEDVPVILDLVRSYMSRPRSIIMAVVSAKSDQATQLVLDLVSDLDPTGMRTLGVITMPDLAPKGSKTEDDFIHLAKNVEHKLRLGWHVLKNQDWDQHCSMDERDQYEREFFEDSRWGQELDADTLGVGALRERLAKLLETQIRSTLPEVITAIEENRTAVSEQIERLGPDRNSLDDQRDYLDDISQHFQRLMHQSLEGGSKSDFFTAHGPTDSELNLRAVLKSLNHNFATVMYERGHKREEQTHNLKTFFRSTYPTIPGFTNHCPERLSREEYLAIIERLIRASDGRYVDGPFHPGVIEVLFREQSKHWQEFAEEHVQLVLKAVRHHLQLAADYVANARTSKALQQYIISVEMEKKRKLVTEKVRELVWPYRYGPAITYTHQYQDVLKAAKTSAQQNPQGNPNNSISGTSPGRKSTITGSAGQVLRYMNAYYEVTLPTFIDNIANLAIEMCVVHDLGEIFTPSTVRKMNEAMVKNLASESPSVQKQRSKLSTQFEQLNHAYSTCLPHSLGKFH
ncbi:dynamin family protein [Tothia fuscella]|uniref:Dynamin family protein n=1 Tax=Tothia fuscella TaxID=1048955 RepID=A0A9P4P2T1_9PEZI|nr:dynamin family protein [Tothia fuscella]